MCANRKNWIWGLIYSFVPVHLCPGTGCWEMCAAWQVMKHQVMGLFLTCLLCDGKLSSLSNTHKQTHTPTRTHAQETPCQKLTNISHKICKIYAVRKGNNAPKRGVSSQLKWYFEGCFESEVGVSMATVCCTGCLDSSPGLHFDFIAVKWQCDVWKSEVVRASHSHITFLITRAMVNFYRMMQ